MRQWLSLLVLICMGCVPQKVEKQPAVTGNVGVVTQVTREPGIETWPRPSPDGRSVLYTSEDPSSSLPTRYRLATVPSNGGSSKQLVGSPGSKLGAWSPSGAEIVYIYHTEGRHRLVRSPASGSGITFISPSPLGDLESHPDISPDGRRIAFHTNHEGKTTIFTIGVDGTAITKYVDGFGSAPRWHPTGTRIVFDREVDGKTQIVTMDVRTGQETIFGLGEGSNAYPSWSPDGRWIVFQSNRTGRWQLYAMRADGSQLTQFTNSISDSRYPSWGRDGAIYFEWVMAPNNSDIWKLTPRLPPG